MRERCKLTTVSLFKTILLALQIGATQAATLGPVDAELLERHVAALAGEIGERNLWRPQALRRAADYLRAVWERLGYEVVSVDYEIDGEIWSNLEASRAGRTHPAQIILLGAHYDSVLGSPGANDNASGLAALLELSRLMARAQFPRTVRFVAFVNEEPPFFYTEQMGSYVYARAARARGDDIRAMFSLETMGYFRDEPKTQRYPPFFDFFYPDRGNFIAFVSNWRSRGLLKAAVAAFRRASDFPVEHAAVPPFVPGAGWSDHLNFWRFGYPAVMVTDTAPYRYPYYHTAEDTPEKIDYRRLAQLVQGLAGMVEALADPDDFPAQPGGRRNEAATSSNAGRSVPGS